jgi:branched-chain amino acid transport system ATP-binding protein/branched-chain amino acid transport system permease protein
MLLAVLLPFVLRSGYVLDIADDMIIWAVLTIGLNLVVGFSGLLDLGYIAFFAIGGYTFGILGSKFGISMWVSLPVAALLVMISSVVIGIPTLRLKSDYLAIMTLGFGEIIFLSANNLNGITGGPNGLYDMPAPHFFGLVLKEPGQFYWFLLVVLAIAVVAVSRLRASHVGRAWLAIRQDELAAKANGVEVVRYKLLAYMGGAVWAGLVGVIFAAKQTIVSPTSFQFSQSFFVLASVIIGGMGSVPGAIVGGFLFVLISESLQGIAQSYSSVVFSVALLAVILLRPKGIWPASFHSKLGRVEAEKRPPSGALSGIKELFSSHHRSHLRSGTLPRSGSQSGSLLRVGDLSVRFGGVQALDGVSLSVEDSEIVSVIGPNGAGKTTLLNAISGFVRPQRGVIELLGLSITRMSVESRTRMGLARTFQTPRLLSTLNVLENVMQGAHITFRVSALSAAVGTLSQRREEHVHREEAIDILNALGLLSFAGANPTELSYGDQRRCEIARCLAFGPRLILLDEPAAGMNAKETNDLGDLLLRVRGLGVTLLLIDHDMSLVGKVSDRVIALDRGAQVAAGSVETVFHHPAVVQSYLGA